MTDRNWIDLADAVAQLRRELESALAAEVSPRIRFELGPVELEFTAEIKSSGGIDGGIRWGVLSLGSKGERAKQSGHRVKLVLQPKDAISGKNAEIAASRPELPPVR